VLAFMMAGSKASTYTAESRVAVGKGDLTSGAIAGFPMAASAMASNYARYVSDSGIEGKTSVPAGVEVTASQIPESAVIRIETTGMDREAVVQAAQSTADDLVKKVNAGASEADPATTLEQYRKASADWAAAKATREAAQSRVGELSGRGSTAAARAAANKAKADAEARESFLQVQMDGLGDKYRQQISQSSTAANLTVVKEADIVKSDKAGRQQRMALIGLAAGLALALVIATLLERAARRRPSPRRSESATSSDPTVQDH